MQIEGYLVPPVLIGFLLVGTASPSESNVLVMSFLAGVSFNGMQAFMYAVAAHSYPTEIRGSAVGLAQTVSRIGAVLSPIVASGYLAMSPLPGVNLFFWFVAACAFITALSFFLIPSHIPRQDPPPPVRTTEPEQFGEKRVTVQREAQTPLLVYAYKSPAANDPLGPAIR